MQSLCRTETQHNTQLFPQAGVDKYSAPQNVYLAPEFSNSVLKNIMVFLARICKKIWWLLNYF
jgi:hypothetical protein